MHYLDKVELFCLPAAAFPARRRLSLGFPKVTGSSRQHDAKNPLHPAAIGRLIAVLSRPSRLEPVK